MAVKPCPEVKALLLWKSKSSTENSKQCCGVKVKPMLTQSKPGIHVSTCCQVLAQNQFWSKESFYVHCQPVPTHLCFLGHWGGWAQALSYFPTPKLYVQEGSVGWVVSALLPHSHLWHRWALSKPPCHLCSLVQKPWTYFGYYSRVHTTKLKNT